MECENIYHLNEMVKISENEEEYNMNGGWRVVNAARIVTQVNPHPRQAQCLGSGKVAGGTGVGRRAAGGVRGGGGRKGAGGVWGGGTRGMNNWGNGARQW